MGYFNIYKDSIRIYNNHSTGVFLMEPREDMFKKIIDNYISINEYASKLEKILNDKIDYLDKKITNLESSLEEFKESCSEHRMEIERQTHSHDIETERTISKLGKDIIESHAATKTEIKWTTYILTAIISSVFAAVVSFLTLFLKSVIK